jgi:hypothetical protein
VFFDKGSTRSGPGTGGGTAPGFFSAWLGRDLLIRYAGSDWQARAPPDIFLNVYSPHLLSTAKDLGGSLGAAVVLIHYRYALTN